MKEQIIRQIKSMVQDRNFTINSELTEILDSSTFIKTIAEMEKIYEIKLDDNMLLISDFPTVESLINYVVSKVNYLNPKYKTLCKMSKLYIAGVTDRIDYSKFKFLQSLVSNEKQEKVNHYRFDIDKKLSLYSELLTRILVCCNTDIKNKEIVFDKTYYGKPFLRGLAKFDFNISHTKNAIAVAISDHPIGVDIERVMKAEVDIANRFFQVNETSYITENKSDQDKRFYEIWTKKEAFIKHIGKGLAMDLKSFNVLDNKILSYFCYIKGLEYVISVCNGMQKTEIIELSEQDIEEMSMIVLV